MASTSYGNITQADGVRLAIAEVKTLTVERLKRVLRGENLTVGGVKNELQIRLIAHIERCAAAGDIAVIDRVRIATKGGFGFANPNPYPSPYSNHTPNSSLSPQYNSPTPRNPPPPVPSYSSMSPFMPARIAFKSSPFYTILKALSGTQELKAREQTRDTARISLRLDHADVDRLQRDPNTRIMIFCAAENPSARSDPCDIAFPQHGELKCNSDDVKHNLKGMKGKPGTTRPADITQYIRKTPTYPNTVELVYALTTKSSSGIQKYFLVVNMVQKKPMGSLVAELKHRRTPYSKDRVIREMRSKADDPDIVATSTNMSLKDPLQMTRIRTPCRGLSCTHNGCFDAEVYLALQEQAPTWTCPICHKPASWENVAFDHYFDDILQRVAGDVEQVTIEPNGEWHQGETAPSDQDQGHGHNKGPHDDDDDDDYDDDDDIVEITEHKHSVARDLMRTSSEFRTPPINGSFTTAQPISTSTPMSAATSTPTSAYRPNKRTHSETIDLTLDDSDEDEPPISRVKRPSISSQQSLESFRSRPVPTEPYRFHMPPPNSSSSAANRYYSNF